MAAAAIGTALEYAPHIMSAASTAYNVGKNYVPHIKRLANNLFSAKKRRSAMDYVRGLAKPKGLKKLVTKDLPTAVKGASNLISSGKLMKGVSQVAQDAHTVLGASKPLLGDKYQQATSMVNQGVSKAQHFHDIASKYNEQGKQLATQFDKQFN